MEDYEYEKECTDHILGVYRTGVFWPEGLLWRGRHDALIYLIGREGEEMLSCAGPYGEGVIVTRGEEWWKNVEEVFKAIDAVKQNSFVVSTNDR